jgi:hypothetical protein
VPEKTGGNRETEQFETHGLERLVSQEFPMKIAHGTSESKVKQTMPPRPQEPVEDIENMVSSGNEWKEYDRIYKLHAFHIIPYHSIAQRLYLGFPVGSIQ